MPGPLCKKHNLEKIPMQLGKKKLWCVACPKCQKEKAATPPAADPSAKPAAASAVAPVDEKKTEHEPGWFFSRKKA